MTAKKRVKTWMYIPDPHGDHVCGAAWEVARQFHRDYQPDEVIYGGDVFDLRALRKGASKEEQDESLQPDFEAGMKLFRDIPPTHFIQGNHDYRAWVVAKKGNGTARDFCQYLVGRVEAWAKAEGVTIYPYRANSYCRLNDRLKLVHGNIVNMHVAKALAEYGGEPGCVVGGHTHGHDYYQVKSLLGLVQEAYVVGCLSEIWQEYNETRPNTTRHRHGFAFGEYAVGGKGYCVQVAKEDDDGLWRIPTAIKVYGKAHK
jgi:UDP-2,3-diacylglucosamine pyrophosphatase LpxH